MTIKKDDLELFQKALEEEDRVSGCHGCSPTSDSVDAKKGSGDIRSLDLVGCRVAMTLGSSFAGMWAQGCEKIQTAASLGDS